MLILIIPNKQKILEKLPHTSLRWWFQVWKYEKAAVQKDDCAYGVCGSGCCSGSKNNNTVANAPTKPVVNEPAPDPKNCGYCSGSFCVGCANGDDDKGECTNNTQCAPGSVNAPPPATIQPLTTTPINNTLEQAEVQNIQQVITAPVVINGTVVNPATSVPVSQNTAAGGAPVTNTVVTPPVTPKTCDANGTTYPENAVIQYGSGTYRKCVGGTLINNCGGAGGAIELCSITDLTVIPPNLQTQYNQAIQQQNTVPAEAYVAGPVMQTPRPQTNTNNQTTTTNTTASVNNNSSVSTSSTCSPGCPSGQSCVLIGIGYYGCQNTGSLTSYAKKDCGGACATNQTCEQSGDKYVCKTVEYVAVAPKCPSGATWINNTCVSNQVIQNQPTASVVTTSLQDFINSLTNRFNNVSQSTGMTDIGTYGLGGGNAPVVTPPLSVLTSSDPNALSNFNRGAAISGAAGVVTAATILAAPSAITAGSSAISEISALAGANASLTSIAQATAAYGGATLATLPTGVQAAIAYTTSALTIGGTAYATADCIASNDPTSPSCTGLVTGYQADPVGFNQELANSGNTLENGLNTIINSQTSQNIINQVRDRLDYAYTQSGMAETFSGNLYAFNPLFRPSNIDDEFATIRNVRDAYQRYGPAMAQAAKNGDVDALYAIAESVGYRPVELPIGSQIEVPTRDGFKVDTLSSNNSVRIGTNNTLYVGTDTDGLIDVADLCHDIGACVLGGKIVKNGGRIPIDVFNTVTQASVDRTFPLQILDDKNIIDYVNGTAYILDTWLYDSLLKSNGIPYQVIKYIP